MGEDFLPRLNFKVTAHFSTHVLIVQLGEKGVVDNHFLHMSLKIDLQLFIFGNPRVIFIDSLCHH